MSPRSLRLSLIAVQLVGVLTLLRSVAFDRWITVLTSVLLIAGARAALRGRTWGIGLTFAAAAWFPVAWAIGIAPAWFVLVGIVGALPFASTWRALARFDGAATALFAAIAASVGVLGAMAWKSIGWSVFMALPFLRPSGEPQHGLALIALVAGALAAAAHVRRTDAGDARVRIASRARIGDTATGASESASELTAETAEVAGVEDDEPVAHLRAR